MLWEKKREDMILVKNIILAKKKTTVVSKTLAKRKTTVVSKTFAKRKTTVVSKTLTKSKTTIVSKIPTKKRIMTSVMTSKKILNKSLNTSQNKSQPQSRRDLMKRAAINWKKEIAFLNFKLKNEPKHPNQAKRSKLLHQRMISLTVVSMGMRARLRTPQQNLNSSTWEMMTLMKKKTRSSSLLQWAKTHAKAWTKCRRRTMRMGRELSKLNPNRLSSWLLRSHQLHSQ